MTNVLQKALTLLTGVDKPSELLKVPKRRPLKQLTERELIQLESEIGRELFGPIPKGHQREFFNLDPTTWIWYEEYTDKDGRVRTSTTRYELQGDRILKAQDGAQYSYLDGAELDNLLTAVEMYYEQIARKIYRRDPQTGEPLS